MKKFWLTLVCILSIWTISIEYSNAQNIESDNLIVDACQLIEDKEYDKALEVLEKAREANPENDAAYFYLSQIYAYKGDSERTETYLNKAIELDPDNFWYRYTSCMLYNSLHELDKSIALYEDLIKDFPKNTNLYYELTNLYTAKKDYNKVLEVLQQVDEITGKTEQTTLARYELLCILGREQEAFEVLADYNREFSSPDILCQMGDHSKRMYQDSLALAYYDEALSLDKDYPRAILGKGDIHLYRREYKEFLSAVKKTVHNPMTPPNVLAFYTDLLSDFSQRSIHDACPAETDSLMTDIYEMHKADTIFAYPVARYYYITGREEKTKDVFKTTSDLNPEDIRPYYNFVNYYIVVKDWKGLAEEIKERGLERFPKDLQLGEILNYAYYELEDYKGIIENSYRIIEENAGNKEIELNMLGQIGDMHHNLGEKKLAYKIYEKALKIDENYIPVLNNYAYFLSLDGKKLKKAYNMSKKTVEAEPNNATYLDTIGWILCLQGKYAEAKTYFKQAMLYGGKESATSMIHYSIVLDALGEKDLAAFYRTRAENLEKKQE